MKPHFAVAVLLVLAGCAGYSPGTVDADGIYRFREAPVEVRSPAECLYDPRVYVARSTVLFTTGAKYWRGDGSGEYYVELADLPEALSDAATFVAAATEIHREEHEKSGGRLESEEILEINGRLAFRSVGTHRNFYVMVATSIQFPEHFVVAQLIYPQRDVSGQALEIPWACYERFVASIDYAGQE